MLEEAAAALKTNDFEIALQVLLKAWRETSAPSVAEAIDRVTAMSNRASLSATTREKRLVEWDETDARQQATDVEALLEAIPGFRVADAVTRLEKLTERGSDPRITDAVLEWFREPPTGFRGAGSMAFWFAGKAALTSSRDTRVASAIPELRTRWKDDDRNAVGEFMRLYLSGILKAAVAWTAKPFDTSALDALAGTRHAGASTDQLLQAVYQEPGDLSLRRVYADALLEAGDPRGEFISLQLAGTLTAAQRKRETALRKKHERVWLGAVGPAVLKTGLTFAHGFPVAAKISLGIAPYQYGLHHEHDRFIGLDEWSTFETLDLASWNGNSAALISHPVMRSLKTVVGAHPDVLKDLKSERLEHLATRHQGDDKDVRQFFESRSMPALRTLAIEPTSRTAAGLMNEVRNTPMMQHLETLTLIDSGLRYERTADGWKEVVHE